MQHRFINIREQVHNHRARFSGSTPDTRERKEVVKQRMDALQVGDVEVIRIGICHRTRSPLRIILHGTPAISTLIIAFSIVFVYMFKIGAG
jgi:hypothetical protein